VKINHIQQQFDKQHAQIREPAIHQILTIISAQHEEKRIRTTGP